MRTAGVKKLVSLALESLPKPYTEDVIDDVFFAIESNDTFKVEYEGLCADLGKTVVNTWGGYWIANSLGKFGLQQIPTKKSTLINSYSKLTASATATNGTRKEAVALQLMSDYYKEHKAKLPKNISKHRELIVELLVKGLSPEQAFTMVQESDT
jgi:hypothetical protein